MPVYRSTKDSRNTILWQPSVQSLRNREKDEAGRLAAFRGRFGRGWDAQAAKVSSKAEEVKEDAATPVPSKESEQVAGQAEMTSYKPTAVEAPERAAKPAEQGDLMDLINGDGWGDAESDSKMYGTQTGGKAGADRGAQKTIGVLRGGKLVKVTVNTGEKPKESTAGGSHKKK